MKKLKQGWVEGSVQEFLELSAADMEYIETRRALSRQLRAERQKKHLTQTELAARLKTSQSRVAKMEQGDPTVSLDLLIQSLYRVGMTRKSVAAAM
ncbi:MAG: helix-turn-helix transcriptional regulator [Kiritimatiellaeota bacterium]|nr:helix-turn-helix transcriptional regulator [Kiritimatiellota bacterium]